MRMTELMPGDANAGMISSIINLVCPQCGGAVVEFECGCKWRRNWLAENGSGATSQADRLQLRARQ